MTPKDETKDQASEKIGVGYFWSFFSKRGLFYFGV
jgi:hypothetical protein